MENGSFRYGGAVTPEIGKLDHPPTDQPLGHIKVAVPIRRQAVGAIEVPRR